MYEMNHIIWFMDWYNKFNVTHVWVTRLIIFDLIYKHMESERVNSYNHGFVIMFISVDNRRCTYIPFVRVCQLIK